MLNLWTSLSGRFGKFGLKVPGVGVRGMRAATKERVSRSPACALSRCHMSELGARPGSSPSAALSVAAPGPPLTPLLTPVIEAVLGPLGPRAACLVESVLDVLHEIHHFQSFLQGQI